MNIKQLDVKDINMIIELIWNVQIEFGQVPVMFQDEESKECFKSFVLEKMNEELKFFGMFNEENLIGVIGLEHNRVSYLYVLKEYQRNGIGTKLLRFGLEVLKEYDTVVIDSVDEAKTFYKKNGFHNIKNKDYSVTMEYKRKRFRLFFKI